MKTVFVTGGTGFIGKHVLRQLTSMGGLNVVALSRSARPNSEGVTWLHGDIGDARVLNEAVARADVVVHLAGCKKNPREFHAANILGTRNVLSACEKANSPRLIYLSSVGVIGQTSETIITELTPCSPVNEYERTKHEAELLVRQYSAQRPGTTTTLRPTNVFGEDDPERHLLNLMTRLKAHRFFFVGRDISQYHLNYLYVKEISALIGTLLTSSPASDLFIINTPTPLAEFIATMKRLLNDDASIKSLPYWPVKAAALSGDLVQRAGIMRPPINSLKLSELTNRKQYSAALLARETGWRPAFSVEDALRNIVSHYAGQGLLK